MANENYCSSLFYPTRIVSHHQSLSGVEFGPPPQFPSEVRERISTFLPLPEPLDFRLLDCFKEWLLLGVQTPGQDFDHSELCRTYLVCNPYTKQWVALPLAPERSSCCQSLVVKLVGKPCTTSSTFELGISGAKEEEEEVSSTYHSEFRFRLVRVPFDYLDSQVDVFCSEYGEWTNVFLDGLCGDDLALDCGYLVSINSNLYWECRGQVIGWSPFWLDGPPPTVVSGVDDIARLSTSEGSLYVILLEKEGSGGGRHRYSRAGLLSVWKSEQEEGRSDSRRSWRIHCQVAVDKLSCVMKNGREVKWSELKYPAVVAHHGERPEIVFLQCIVPPAMDEPVDLYCNLKTGELGLCPDQRGPFRELLLLQSRYHLRPTRIATYEKLRGMYDGSYPFFRTEEQLLTCSMMDCNLAG